MLAMKLGLALWSVATYAHATDTTVTATTSMCFPEHGVPLQDRVNIDIDGANMPLGVYWLEWGSAILNAEVFRIYAEEIVGLKVQEYGHSVVVESGNWAVAGCPGDNPGVGANPGPGCDLLNNPVSTSHVVLETWDFYMGSALAALEEHYVDRMPLNMGDVGFDGVSSNWVPGPALEEAYSARGLAMHTYAAYDDRWWTPFEYMDSIDALNTTDFFTKAAWCNEYPPMNDHQMSLDYLNFVGDSDGMVTYTDTAGATRYRANCVDGKWWLSPRCRLDRSRCIPYVSYSGWGMSGIIQKATEFHMAVAMVSMVDAGDWNAAVKNFRVLTYWWIPDAAYLEQDLRLVIFPRLNPDQHAVGHFITEFGAVKCIKWGHVNLEMAHPRIFRSLLNHKVTMTAMMEMLTEHHMAPKNTTHPVTYSYREVACRWMRRNWDDRTVWRNWIPDPTACLVGQGLTTDARGELTCDWCPQATRSEPHPNMTHSRHCVECDPGTYQELSGQSSCDPCEPGSYTDQRGQDACKRCPLGSFQNESGASVCSSCETIAPKMTTIIMGAVERSDCGCPRGTFQCAHEGDCHVCTEGQVCEGFDLQFPLQEEGYYLENNSLLDYPAWRCKTSKDCPHGPPETCGQYRRLDKLACGECATDAFKSDSGSCEPCGDQGSKAPLVLLFIFALCVMPVVHVAVNYPLQKTSRYGMQSVFLGGMAVTTIMTFNIYNRMDIAWEPPLSNFFAVLRVFAFNLSIMRFSCVMGTDAQVPQYVSKIVAVPIAMSMLVFATGVVFLIKPLRRFAYISLQYYTNTFGLIFSIFFIPVSLLSTEPFQCVSHPSGYNTLAHDRSVVCFEWSSHAGEHEPLVWLSILAIIIYPVTFLTVTALMTLNYRRWMNKYGVTFSRRARFLTNRMDPDMYFFGFFYNLRNFCLTLAPVMFPNSFGVQIFMLLLIFILWFNLSTHYRPWRFQVLNKFDAFTNTMHIICLVCFALLADSASANSGGEMSKAQIGWLVIASFTIATLALGVVGLRAVYKKFNGQREFGTFISHHKGAAALTARRVKMLLQEHTTGKHFLDVDELTNLDNLLFTVRSNTENLVVLLTPEILSRFWCAAEITCAFINRVPITLVAVDKPYLFEGKYLDDVEKLWSPVQVAEFTKADMTMKDIESAFKYLSTQQQIDFRTNAPDADQTQSIQQVIKKCKGRPLKTKMYYPDPERMIFITLDTESGKQRMVAHILCQLFKAASWSCIVCEDDTTSYFENKYQVALGVVLISAKLPYNPVALGNLVAVYKKGWNFLCVQSQEEFTKPAQAWFNDMAKGQILSEQDMAMVRKIGGTEATGFDICKSLKALYRVLAWRIHPEGGEKVMMQEFLNIYTRVESESIAKRMSVSGALIFQDDATMKSDAKSDASEAASDDKCDDAHPAAKSLEQISTNLSMHHFERCI